MLSYTFGVLKPDCQQRGLVKVIMKMILEIDLRFVVSKQLILTKEEVASIYFDSVTHSYFDDHVKFMTSGFVTAFVVTGENAVQRLNRLVGYTIPAQSAPGTIRRMGIDICRNLIHSSSDFPHFLKEAQTIFYGPEFEYLYREEYFL